MFILNVSVTFFLMLKNSCSTILDCLLLLYWISYLWLLQSLIRLCSICLFKADFQNLCENGIWGACLFLLYLMIWVWVTLLVSQYIAMFVRIWYIWRVWHIHEDNFELIFRSQPTNSHRYYPQLNHFCLAHFVCWIGGPGQSPGAAHLRSWSNHRLWYHLTMFPT